MEQNAVQEKYAILKINVHPFQISNTTKVVVSKRNFAPRTSSLCLPSLIQRTHLMIHRALV